MIASLYQTIGPWSWMILGLCLIAVAVLLPGLFFFWFGLAAIGVGVAALVLAGFVWQLQIVAFLAAACLIVLAGRLWTRRRRAGDAEEA